MRQELFRKQDYHAALREHSSILDCAKAIEDCVRSGDLREAYMFVRDINSSLEVLKRLAEKQKQEIEVKQLLDKLVAAGINAMVVKRFER